VRCVAEIAGVSKKASSPGRIHLRIVEVLKRFPDGASGGQIRQELEKDDLLPEEQTHLDRPFFLFKTPPAVPTRKTNAGLKSSINSFVARIAGTLVLSDA